MSERRIVELDERSGEILRLIVRLYIRSGQPVGSRTLSKAIQNRLSPATIRNIMADLEDTGYLVQPHTSAGRVPSERGYRYYVDSLGASRPPRAAEEYIDRALREAATPEAMMATACHLLSDLSQNIGIVVSPPIGVSKLRHIEFLRVDDSKILLILVSDAGLLQQRLIRVSEPYVQEELTRAGNALVGRFSGWTLPDIRRELVRMMAEDRLLYDRMLRMLIESWSLTMDEAASSAAPGTVYVQGTGNILSKIDFSDLNGMQELFRMFEEKGRLVKILNDCLQSESDDGVQIMIGSELGMACMRDLTVITSPYLQQAGSNGFVGIIGPTRMEYRRGISVVGYMASVFNRMMSA